ncbi:retrovirus-related Pol polyprotein from type-1 retrotransposable element R2 [Nephila pilipes]|uniref:Retrovirus-related Pol polyprotein from type-1 retrotransposable element R2 n=1 Tax=Nephila pilipes TaxID=299642 RepID=A0A8X6Q498_NEPPI|nr:retrovirus-related Pol polyprotein from type-1 retrotransposable element R2 [Nephila pilipes]
MKRWGTRQAIFSVHGAIRHGHDEQTGGEHRENFPNGVEQETGLSWISDGSQIWDQDDLDFHEDVIVEVGVLSPHPGGPHLRRPSRFCVRPSDDECTLSFPLRFRPCRPGWTPVPWDYNKSSRGHRIEDGLKPRSARRIVSQRTPTPGVSYASKIKKTFKSCTTQTDSDLNQPNSAAICSSKSETTNSKIGVKSPRKNKQAQLREAKGDGRKKPPKIKKTEIPALDLHPTADDYSIIQLQSVEHWCSVCNSKMKTRPALHPCIKSSLTVPPSKPTPSTFLCHSCNFNATSQIALFLHQRAHKKEYLAEASVPLKTFPTPKERKNKRKKKLAPLLQGSPRDHPIAPPLTPFNSIPHPDRSTSSTSSTVDLVQLEEPNLLASFIEPLEVFFEDGIDNKMALLENLLQDITSVIQEKFSLTSEKPIKPKNSNNSLNKNSRSSDSQDAQSIQKAYNWNRRKCIRNLINPSNARCSIQPTLTHSFFSNIWNASEDHSIPDFGSPPDLPPIVESLDQDLVRECLQSTENTAPGPDGIAYKHWRVVDPSGNILSIIFNLCQQLRGVPDTWKSSNTILIHKKGVTEDLSNWRPISLSNTIYKIFTKCHTRKLGDWCSFHQRLSPN